jgi:hypothetical protein
MSAACGTRRKEKKCVRGMVRKPEEKRPPKDLYVDGRILKLTSKNHDERV